jgi:hypothetical protein
MSSKNQPAVIPFDEPLADLRRQLTYLDKDLDNLIRLQEINQLRLDRLDRVLSLTMSGVSVAVGLGLLSLILTFF